MKNKLPALLLAVGMTASPVFAKKANRKSDTEQDSKRIEQSNKKDRKANALKRFKQLEAEKEFIKETEKEISNALSGSESQAIKKDTFFYTNTDKSRVVIKDSMPSNGIDISDQFRIIHKPETS